MKSLLITLAYAGVATAQAVAWAQCNGKGWSGPKTCVTGYTCVYITDYFWQCQLSSSAPAAASDTNDNGDEDCPASTESATVSKSSTPTIKATSTSTTSSVVIKSSTTTTTAATSPTTLVTSTTSAAAASGTSSTAVQYLGRVNPATNELSWPGTGLRFSYNGNAEIALTVTGTNSADLIIDGATTFIPSVTDDIPLPAGNHSVEFRKRSEAGLGSIFVQFNGTQASNRLIEFIGDSITVGYGLDGTNPCTNSAEVEDNPKTYAALAADALGADYNVVAWSGKGIVRNIVGDNGPLMTELWTRYGANDADNSYTFPVQAQAVVINLGTNDFTYDTTRDQLDPTAYTNGVVNFAQTVLGKYPGAKIFLMSSPMLLTTSDPTTSQHTIMSNALQNAANTLGATFVDWPTQGSDVGCDYHPNAATHAAEASVLADAMRPVLGW